jgi:CDP-glucose 4,6-dehydratase
LSFAETVDLTASWYRDFIADPSQASQITARQIGHYREAVRTHGTR